jgi:hypothetical protein
LEESPESDSEDSTATTVSYTIMPRRFGGELFMVSHDSVAPKGETSAQQGTHEGRNTDYVRRHREEADVAAATTAKGDPDNVAGNPRPFRRNLEQEFFALATRKLSRRRAPT